MYFTVAAIRLWTGRDDGPGPYAPVWKCISTMGVTVTFLVFWLILRMGVSFESFSSAALLGLHHWLAGAPPPFWTSTRSEWEASC